MTPMLLRMMSTVRMANEYAKCLDDTEIKDRLLSSLRANRKYYRFANVAMSLTSKIEVG